MASRLLFAFLSLTASVAAGPVTDAVHRAAEFYHGEVASHGGYVYYYAPDLSWRHGESRASPAQIGGQPPGTPTVGAALLKTYQTTRAPFLLEATTDAADALIYGQLQSGGRTDSIDFDPAGKTALYRNGKGRGKNNSSLDDGQTQAAIRFLVQLPAIAGRESVDAVATLLLIAHTTGDRKSLKPVPAALAYQQKSVLPDGRLARYYELETNRPLHMSRRGKEYSLTYDDPRLPSHYGWKNEHDLPGLASRHRQLAADIAAPPPPAGPPDVQKILASLDPQGRWISTYAGEPLQGQPQFKPGDRYISSAVFAANITALCEHLDTRFDD